MTTTPINCRALCIELLDKYDLEWRARERLKEVLAQPEPEGPTNEGLIRRLLLLAEQAVNEALEYDYGDPEDRHIWRELQELKQLAEKVA